MDPLVALNLTALVVIVVIGTVAGFGIFTIINELREEMRQQSRAMDKVLPHNPHNPKYPAFRVFGFPVFINEKTLLEQHNELRADFELLTKALGATKKETEGKPAVEPEVYFDIQRKRTR